MPGARGWILLLSQYSCCCPHPSKCLIKNPTGTELFASIAFQGIQQDDGASQTIAQTKGKHPLNKIRLPETEKQREGVSAGAVCH